MKTFTIAIAAAASLVGATFVNSKATAAPGFQGPGNFQSKMGGGGGGGYKPGHFKAGNFKPGVKPGLKPGPGGFAAAPGKGGGGAWKHPHKGHGNWHGNGWGYAAAGLVGAAYFARPLYTSTYSECEWVRVRTEFGPRWRPYC